MDGERDGLWIMDAEGQVVFEGAFVAGSHREHVGYWPTGIRNGWVVQGGLRDGNWRYFDGSGNVTLIRRYGRSHRQGQRNQNRS